MTNRSKELDEAQELLAEDEVAYLQAQSRAITMDLLQNFVKSGLATQEDVDRIIKEMRDKDGLN